MGDEQKTYANANTAVFWDLNNCQVPKDTDGVSIVPNISAALRTVGYEGPVSVFIYGNVKKIDPEVHEALHKSDNTFIWHFPPIYYKDAYRELMFHMLTLADENAPCNCMLISDDEALFRLLNNLRKMDNVNVLLARTPWHAPSRLTEEANKVWLLNSLLSGEPPCEDIHAYASNVQLPEVNPRWVGRLLLLNNSYGIVLVDELVGLDEAIRHILGCKVISLTFEWEPHFRKYSREKGLSTMQIATEKNRVYIIDFVKLFNKSPVVIDDRLFSIFRSPQIVKLGYLFLSHVEQFGHSYGYFNCFRDFKNLHDFTNRFKGHQGGLSALAEEVLGVGLNKTRRNFNRKKRLSIPNPVQYAAAFNAAFDAAVLMLLYPHVNDDSPQMEQKSHTISHGGDPENI